MPRSFSVEERASIKTRLNRAGRELFAGKGIRGTSVEDLSRAVGIATGSFYAFYDSKEELYMEILEEEERARDEIFTRLRGLPVVSADRLAGFFEETFDLVENNPILNRLYIEGEYELLLRKLPPERVEGHIRKDDEEIRRFFSDLQIDGRLAAIDPELLSALFRALFTITLHKREIGERHYAAARNMLLRFVAEGLVKDGKEKGGRW